MATASSHDAATASALLGRLRCAPSQQLELPQEAITPGLGAHNSPPAEGLLGTIELRENIKAMPVK